MGKGVRQVSGNATKERNVKTTTERRTRREEEAEIQVAEVWGGVPDSSQSQSGRRLFR